MASPFSDYFRSLVASKGSSLRRVASALDLKPPTLAGILAGRRPMPVVHIAKLAEALALNTVERENLRIEVFLTHCPPEVRAIVADLRAENARLRAAPAKRRRRRV